VETKLNKKNRKNNKYENGNLKFLFFKGYNRIIMNNRNSVELILIFPNLTNTQKGIINEKKRSKSKYDLRK
jgi:hypothetical protein